MRIRMHTFIRHTHRLKAQRARTIRGLVTSRKMLVRIALALYGMPIWSGQITDCPCCGEVSDSTFVGLTGLFVSLLQLQADVING